MPGKYPSKGMNKLAEERPDVARKIMGYQSGGMNDPEARQERLKKAMDLNNDGVVTKEEKEAFEKSLMQDRTKKPTVTEMKDGGMVKKYRYGGMVKRGHGGMTEKGQCRGGRAAIRGTKFTGVK